MIGKIGFLYRMMYELKPTRYNVVIAGKAFDNDLYVYIAVESNKERRGYSIGGSH